MRYSCVGLVTPALWSTHEHTCTHKQSTSCSWIRGHQRHPVSKRITIELAVDPEGSTQRPHQLWEPLSPSQVGSFIPDRSVFLQEASGGEPLEPLLGLTRVQELTTPQLGAHSHVSHHGHPKSALPQLRQLGGGGITSHLSQDYSSDLLPLNQMNAISTKGCGELRFISHVANLLVLLMSARIFVSFVLTLLAEMGINRTRRNSFILKMLI